MKKIFVCSPYQPVSESEAGKKAELEENIYRAKMACRLIAVCGLMPLAPHLYFTAILDDDQKAERERGIQMGSFLVRRSRRGVGIRKQDHKRDDS